MEAPFDICVIGAGSGGLTVAAAAAAFGQRVALIEKGEMGGECLNTGCVPSKALIAAARQAQVMRSGSRVGIGNVEPGIDFAQVHQHVLQSIAAIAPHDSQERFEKLGVRVIRAGASFTGPDRIEAGGAAITARRFVIATGSRPDVPPIAGLASVPHFTNETIFGLDSLPSHLIVIGGGAIGIELAQAYRRLGSQVTVIESQQPLSREDPELAGVVLGRLRAEGVTILERTAVTGIGAEKGGLRLEIEDASGRSTVTGSHLLVATGRRPNVEGLHPERAGISLTPKGITVDHRLRTSNRRVYAIGDVNGGSGFTHVAAHQAELVIRHMLFRLPVRYRPEKMPRVTFADPELAQAGLTESEARQQAGGSNITVLRSVFRDNDRALTEAETGGLVKIVVGSRGRIVGAGIAGPGAGELIAPWLVAISKGLKVSALASAVFPYPTLGEASRRAAISYYAGLASRPWVRSVIRWIGRFG